MDKKWLNHMVEYETFAESVALLGRAYPVNASTIEAVEMIVIPAEVIKNLVKQNTDLALKMLSGLSVRVHKFINDSHTLSMATAQQKVAGYFLALISENNNEQCIELPSKKAIVASRLGLKPETFSRVLASMKEQHIIRVEKSEIWILNPEKLSQLKSL